jgi:XTP/dITP diphosphohydrolase
VERLTAILCSQNAHKARELEAVLPGWRIEPLGAASFPAESGATYEENARAKALLGRAVGPASAWMLGEDSGIEVDALGGGPGVRSARFADDPVTALLDALAGADERSARYVCALVAIAPDGEEVCARGELEGAIAREARGFEGFGYDPVFVPRGETRTVAELGDSWKREHTHRARAAGSLAAALARSGALRGGRA